MHSLHYAKVYFGPCQISTVMEFFGENDYTAQKMKFSISISLVNVIRVAQWKNIIEMFNC